MKYRGGMLSTIWLLHSLHRISHFPFCISSRCVKAMSETAGTSTRDGSDPSGADTTDERPNKRKKREHLNCAGKLVLVYMIISRCLRKQSR
jgi:hypothetical protein